MNVNYFERLAQIESGGDPNAKNPNSSATGLFQFTNATAEQYGLDDPTDPVKSREAVEKFTQDNANQLQKVLGRTPTDGELYLAHQQGAGGALKLLSNPDKPAIEVVGLDQVKNNGGNEDMTAKEFADMWVGKFGGQSAVENKDNKGAGKSKSIGKTISLPDGGTIQLTGSESPENLMKLKRKLLEKYGSSIKVDRKTGAHPSVRAFVGAVNDPEDKLASLQKYYPDAVPYGDDNFAFVNPDTGKLTLYNPKGLDLGDWASITKEGFQIAGGTLGAVGGGAIGTAVAPGPGTVAGGVAGAGTGFATAGTAYDTLVEKLGLTVDTRDIGEKAVDFGIDVAIGAAGEGIGLAVATGVKAGARATSRAISNKLKQSIGGGEGAAQRLLTQFRSFGIEPSPSLVTKKSGMARLETSLQQNPITAEVMEKQAKTVVDDTQTALTKIISDIGEPKTAQGAGETIQQAAINAAKRFEFRQEKLYTEAFDLIGSETPVAVGAADDLLKEMYREINRAPNSLEPALGGAIKELEAIVADAVEGIPFAALKQVRTAIGKNLAEPLSSGATSAQNMAMKRVYGALTEDLSSAASNTSAEAAKKLATADRYTRLWSNTAKDTMEKIAKFDAEERAFKFAMSASNDGGSSLARLRRNFTNEEWDTVAASVLNKLGDATPGAQNAAGDAFSINTFLTNWNRLSPEAKSALFGGNRYKPQRDALDQLTVLMERVKDVSRFSNTSNTAGALQAQLLLSGLGATSGYIATGDLKGAAIGAGAAFTPRMAAKLITSPKFVTWLAEPLEKSVSSGARYSTSSHITGLSLIAKEEPDISTEINAYIRALKETTK